MSKFTLFATSALMILASAVFANEEKVIPNTQFGKPQSMNVMVEGKPQQVQVTIKSAAVEINKKDSAEVKVDYEIVNKSTMELPAMHVEMQAMVGKETIDGKTTTKAIKKDDKDMGSVVEHKAVAKGTPKKVGSVKVIFMDEKSHKEEKKHEPTSKKK